MKKIEFHYTYYILVVSFLITGCFINLIAFTSLVVIHELGHYFSCLLLNIKVDKIIIYPYGGITKIDDLIDIDFSKEMLISISGIVFQSIYFFMLFILYRNNFIREYTFDIISKYHFAIVLFNLIPIYPLDGFKILNVFINRFFNFRLSNIISIIISVFNVVIILFVYKFNYSYMMILGIIINYLLKYIKNIRYIYNRFLLEKYLYMKTFDRKRIINNYKKMYRNTNHLIKENNKYQKEKEFLMKMFD